MGEIINPYIAGAPVTEQSMFFGREDIFQWIENSITGQYADHILVIHGQRRVGKTSVLKQLGNRLPNHYIPVFFDLQGRTHTTLDRFIWWLAREIVRVLKQERNIDLPIPEKDDFSRDPEYFENRFLPDLRPVLNNKTLLLTFDEFDNLEENEVKEELARPLVDHLRRLMGHPNLNFIFSIGSSGRKLENMQASYTDFFKSALYKKISFLNEAQTHHLITRPVEGVLKYDNEAVEDIYKIASGHPYFTQLTCHELFARCQRTEQRQIAIEDVEAVLDDVVERGTVNLKFVWDEASDIEKWGLAGLACADRSDTRTLADYLRKNRVRFSETDLTSGLLHLREKDVLTSDNRFVIQLLKRWLQKNRPIEQVREELTEVNPIANRYIEIGLEFKDAGLYEKAISSFQEALTISKENIQAQANIALIYMDQKMYDKAIIEFEKALSMDDEDVSARSGLCGAHLALGDAAMTKGRAKDAAQSYLRVLAINTEHTEARQRMAEISRKRAEELMANGKEDDAENAFLEAWKYTPEDSALNARVEQARAQRKAKRFAELISKSEKEAKAKNWVAAIQSLEEALALSPNDKIIHKKIEEAKAAQEKAQVLAAIYIEAQKGYTDKNYDTAVSLFKKIVLEDENYRDASRLLAQSIDLRRAAPKWWQGKTVPKSEIALPHSGIALNKKKMLAGGGLTILLAGVIGIFFWVGGSRLFSKVESTTTPLGNTDTPVASNTGFEFSDPILAYVAETQPNLEEDFSIPKDYWNTTLVDGANTLADRVSNGVFIFPDSPSTMGLTIEALKGQDFVLEFDYVLKSADEISHILIKYHASGNEANVIKFNPYSFGLQVGTAPNLITEPVAVASNQVYRFKILVQSDQTAIYINEDLIAYSMETSLLSGDGMEFALYSVAGYEGGLDNIKFWNLNPSPPQMVIMLDAIRNNTPFFQTDFDVMDFEGNPVNARIENGKLIVSSADDAHASMDMSALESDKFAIEFDMRILGSSPEGHCIFETSNGFEYGSSSFRAMSAMVFLNGQTSLAHYVYPDQFIDLVSGSEKLDFSNPRPNTYTLVFLGDQIAAFIDDQLAYTALDPAGSVIYNHQALAANYTAECEYDNFKIWDLSWMDASTKTGTKTPMPTSTPDYRTQNPANQHYYRYYFQNLTWNDARDYCASQSGHLVTIQDAEENEFVFQLSGGNSWLGASDVEQEGVWTWVTDEPFNYVNWRPGWPSTGDMGISKGYLGFVNDNSENILPSLWEDKWVYGGNFNFTCEWEP